MIYLLLTWLASPWLWWRSSRRRPDAIRRVIVIQTAKIGDFVATTPVFRALRQRLPGAEISALVHPVNLPLAEGLDCIDRIVVLPATGYRGWAGKRWLFDQMAEGYDAVVVLSPNLATMLVPFWASIPYRVSVLGDRRRGSARLARPFLSHGEAHRPGRLFRETALRALAGLGVTVDDALLSFANEIACPDSGKERAKAVLASLPRPLIGLGLGAGNRMKALSAEQLASLARQVIERSGGSLVLVGTAQDTDAAAELAAGLPAQQLLDTTGQWPLAELPSLLAGLDCFVGVDSGATYLADAVGVPVVDFMGPANADDQRPVGPLAAVIGSDEPCAPCSHAFDAPYRCRLGTRACIVNAPLTAMADAAAERLRSTGKPS